MSEKSAKPLLKRLLLITLAVKVVIILAVFLSGYVFSFCYDCYKNDFSYLPDKPLGTELSFQTWDARHYAFLAEHGYSPDLPSNAFFPLFPWLISVLNSIVQNSVVSGFILASVFSFVMVVFLYLLVEELYNARVAYYTGLFTLAFPTSFFFSLMYSESLFLMLVAAFFYFWLKKEITFAAACALLIPLSRPLGILLLIPLFLVTLIPGKIKFPKEAKYNLPLMLSLVLGFSAYLLCIYVSTGSAWSGFLAQEHFIAGNSMQNLLHPLLWFKKNFLDISLTLHKYTTSIIDRLFFVGFLVSLSWIYKNTDRVLFYYALVMGLVPALLGNFMAYTRYLIVVFPLFIILSLIFKNKSPYVIIPLFVVQVFLLIAHSLNYWVG